MRTPILSAALGLLASVAAAQEATSESYQLLDVALDFSGGGACSEDFALWSSGNDFSSDPLISSNYELSLGFVAAVDPEPGNVPVVFGLDPFFGPMQGGTALTISGLNFDKFGVGASVTVSIAGVPATDVVVMSDTLLTCTAPAVAQGPQTLEVVSSFGAASIAEAYISTPAITSTKVAPPGGQIELRNYGPLTAFYSLYWSFSTTSIVLPPYGTLLIGPSPIIVGPVGQLYPAPDGINVLTFDTPSAPVFAGLTMYWQSLVFVSLAPLEVIFSNGASTQLP